MFIIKTRNILPFIALAGSLFFATEANAKELNVKNEQELQDAINNITEDMNITIDSNYVATTTEGLKLTIKGTHNVTIDANNVNFRGESIIDDQSTANITLKNFLVDGSKPAKFGEEGTLEVAINEGEGDVLIENSIFKNLRSQEKSPVILKGDNSKIHGMKPNKVYLKEVLFEKNEAIKSGGINTEKSNLYIEISKSTFSENESTGGYGGAINIYNSYNKFEIKNTKFIKNRTNRKNAGLHGGAGAIYSDNNEEWAELNIESSIFEKNTVINDLKQNRPVAGAIGLTNVPHYESIMVDRSTFNENKGYGGGAAIAVEKGTDEISSYLFYKNTFYKNETETANPAYNLGGALLIYGNKESDYFIYGLSFYASANTFYENTIKRSELATVPIEVKGSAIGVRGIDGDVQFSTNIHFNNFAVGNSSKTENVAILLNPYTLFGDLGFDNGEVLSNTAEQVYGKYPIELTNNYGLKKAGRSIDEEVVKTLPIAPVLKNNQGEQYVGIANMELIRDDEYEDFDQRGYLRKGNHDFGSIEISSLVYDANGGNFTLPELKKYDGKTYYEGENPAQYANVGVPSGEYSIIDGKKILKPMQKGKVFLGWSDVKNDKLARTQYNAGKKVSVDDQKILYAVWKDETYALKYYNNGKTTGTIPIQKNVKPNSEVTIKSQGKLKRKGYKFSGWSTKPSAKKGEAAYAPGKKLKLVKNTKLYAIWKR